MVVMERGCGDYLAHDIQQVGIRGDRPDAPQNKAEASD